MLCLITGIVGLSTGLMIGYVIAWVRGDEKIRDLHAMLRNSDDSLEYLMKEITRLRDSDTLITMVEEPTDIPQP